VEGGSEVLEWQRITYRTENADNLTVEKTRSLLLMDKLYFVLTGQMLILFFSCVSFSTLGFLDEFQELTSC
jgi:hypothetical protein